MNNYWAFADMAASNDLLEDSETPCAQAGGRGLPLLQGTDRAGPDPRLRHDISAILAARGWIVGGVKLAEAEARGMPVREGDEEYFTAYDEVQSLESFHAIAHDASLIAAVRKALGDTAFPHPLKVARLVFPSEPEVSTPPHQDFLNNQGTPRLTAAWIPLGDCPMKQGTIAACGAPTGTASFHWSSAWGLEIARQSSQTSCATGSRGSPTTSRRATCSSSPR